MAIKTRYLHTNLTVRDLDRQVAFYRDVLGFTVSVPEKTYGGDRVSRLTGVKDASMRVVFLRFPGCGEDGPQLELICYEQQVEGQPGVANRGGFRHIALAVDNSAEAHAAVLAAGGGSVGEVVSQQLKDGRVAANVYATDPEGNIIELKQFPA